MTYDSDGAMEEGILVDVFVVCGVEISCPNLGYYGFQII
jgi:hypothetical protein